MHSGTVGLTNGLRMSPFGHLCVLTLKCISISLPDPECWLLSFHAQAVAAATAAVTHSALQSKEAASRHQTNGHHPDVVAVQHQLAMLQQMYGLPPNAALPATFMAVPFSMQEVQLRMQQQSFMHPGAPVNSTGTSLVKPIVGAPNQIAVGRLDSNVNMHMMNGVHLQAPFAHSVPMAAVAPSDLNTGILQGVPAAGSWVVPSVPLMGIINNPFQQPGIKATSWVK